ncbi:MAG: DUF4870 domain-containing protein [Acidimicrobiia bacterium]
MEPTAESKNWAAIAHFSAFVMFVGIPSFIGPLVVWLMKKDQDEFVAMNAKEALNFNISFFLYGIISALLIILAVGLLLLVIVGIAWLVLVVVAGVKASSGEPYVYPFTLRLVN